MVEKKVASLTLRRERIAKRFEVTYDLKEDMKKRETFMTRLEKIHEWYEEYNETQKELQECLITLVKTEELKKCLDLDEKIDEMYFELCSMKKALDTVQQASASIEIAGKSSSAKINNLKPPRIDIPHFDGKVSEWNTFYSLFKSLVHDNVVYSGIEKFHYLLSALSGPALTQIKNLPMLESNYPIAWSRLVNHYHDSRLLFSHYVDGILQFKQVQRESCNELSRLLNTFQENIEALNIMKIENLFDRFIAHMMIRLMDPVTRRQYESILSDNVIPDSQSVFKFLKTQCRAVGSTEIKEKKCMKSFFTKNSEQFKNCIMCKGSHFLDRCPSLISLNPRERVNKIKSLKLCFNCLKGSHQVQECTSKYTCKECGKRHHTILHLFDSGVSGSTHRGGETATSLTAVNCAGVLLGTIRAECRHANGKYLPVRLVVDSGSQISIMTDECRKRMGLKIKSHCVPINGLGNSQVNCVGVTSSFLKPRNLSGPILRGNFVVMHQITNELPSEYLSQATVSKFSNLKLADERFYEPGQIDILIGVDLYLQIFTDHLNIIGGNPGAMNSVFGYIIMGKTEQKQTPSVPVSFFCETDRSINNLIKSFWEVEEISTVARMSSDDELAEKIFEEKHARQEDGRYVVPLLLKNSLIPENNSLSLAESRLKRLENRLEHYPDLKNSYCEFLREYENLDHMERVPINRDIFYLPHHCVINPSSPTTKLRVVFDGSALTSPNDFSLNSLLLTGPKLQNDIPSIILNFRFHKIVFTCDITKMYRGILIQPSDRKYQNILWRDFSNKSLIAFQLKTVTYGLSSSPYLAIRTLHQLARDEGSKYPRAAKAVLEEFYVDDLITGAESIESALELKHDIVELLKLAKLELSKWHSNNSTLFDSQGQVIEPHLFENSEEKKVVKLLGIQWIPNKDCFTYNIDLESNRESQVCTKRSILSCIARLYDPMGWINPVIFWAKCFMQELWTLKIDWDETVPSHLRQKWQTFLNELPSLSQLNIPRHYETTPNSNLMLVGFCDASQKGYAGVIYLVNLERNSSHLLLSKSKVAPLKTLSIPRLELCAAVLLSNIIKNVTSNIKFMSQIENIYLFTDSTIVLGWLNTSPHLLKTFVANRVVQIHENAPNVVWKHIISEENCADVCSRGLLPTELIIHPLWFGGPLWMTTPVSDWPKSLMSFDSFSELPERKGEERLTLLVGKMTSDIVNRYSSLNRLQRVTAWILRFADRCRESSVSNPNGGLILSAWELNRALLNLIKIEQNICFSLIIEQIRNNKLSIREFQTLKPFVDEHGVVRVGGRLSNSGLPYSQKFPILIPKNSHLTDLIIDYYHKVHLHVGPRTLLSILQRKYWIMSARQKIRSRLSKCIQCFKFVAAPAVPMMGDLPPSRVLQSRPFSRVGVDYGGPFSIKDHKRRGAKITKGYVCLFICQATKAVHLEVVSDLTSEGFIAALDRFVARRGLCAEIISDNGTNFVGANRYLKDLYKFISQQSSHHDIYNYLAEKGIKWSFNPPTGSHFGGLYEAGIKSTKYHLKRVVGEIALTYEEFSTLLSRVEAILNSRPLCQLSSSPDEIDALTPGHFLIGGPLVSLPEYDLSDVNINRLSRWQHVQTLTRSFWKRWHHEYLNSLQQRMKWFKERENICINQIVLIKDDRLPPTRWALGRVTQVHPGKDDTIRVVTLRTALGSVVRPVSKLCPLPSE